AKDDQDVRLLAVGAGRSRVLFLGLNELGWRLRLRRGVLWVDHAVEPAPAGPPAGQRTGYGQDWRREGGSWSDGGAAVPWALLRLHSAKRITDEQFWTGAARVRAAPVTERTVTARGGRSSLPSSFRVRP